MMKMLFNFVLISSNTKCWK